jgi:hypothetical protein
MDDFSPKPNTFYPLFDRCIQQLFMRSNNTDIKMLCKYITKYPSSELYFLAAKYYLKYDIKEACKYFRSGIIESNIHRQIFYFSKFEKNESNPDGIMFHNIYNSKINCFAILRDAGFINNNPECPLIESAFARLPPEYQIVRVLTRNSSNEFSDNSECYQSIYNLLKYSIEVGNGSDIGSIVKSAITDKVYIEKIKNAMKTENIHEGRYIIPYKLVDKNMYAGVYDCNMKKPMLITYCESNGSTRKYLIISNNNDNKNNKLIVLDTNEPSQDTIQNIKPLYEVYSDKYDVCNLPDLQGEVVPIYININQTIEVICNKPNYTIVSPSCAFLLETAKAYIKIGRSEDAYKCLFDICNNSEHNIEEPDIKYQEAFRLLGQCMIYGIGCIRDYKQAINIFKRGLCYFDILAANILHFTPGRINYSDFIDLLIHESDTPGTLGYTIVQRFNSSSESEIPQYEIIGQIYNFIYKYVTV